MCCFSLVVVCVGGGCKIYCFVFGLASSDLVLRVLSIN